MQNKLRVSYYYSFIGKQGNPRAIGKYDAPSIRAFQSCSFQGIGTFRHSEFSGAVAISKTARTAATQDVIMHVIPIAGSDPTSLCFLFWFGCGWLWFFGFLLGQLAGLRTGPLPDFLAIDK